MTRTALRVLGLVALAVAGALLVTAPLRAAAPPALGHVLEERIEALGAAPAPPDLLFFGSSHVGWGLVPEVVDARLAEHGLAIRSYNLGTNRMGCHETDALLRRVLADERLRPAVAVIELCAWRGGLPEDERFTARAIHWHDATATLSLMRTLGTAPDPLPQRLRAAADHALHFAARLFAAGEGARWLRAHLGKVPRDDARIGAILGARGYHGYDMERWRERVPDFAAGYRRKLERMRAAEGEPGRIDAYPVETLRAQIAFVESHGVRPIYLVPPIARRPAPFRALAEMGLPPERIELNDPDRYPELYALDVRWDEHHLTSEGARRLSRVFADRVAELLDAPR